MLTAAFEDAFDVLLDPVQPVVRIGDVRGFLCFLARLERVWCGRARFNVMRPRGVRSVSVHDVLQMKKAALGVRTA
jgi:hypothetical protein